MPDWTVKEQYGRRMQIQNSTRIETIWHVTNTEFELEVIERLISETPDVLEETVAGDLLRSGIPEVTEIGHELWEAKVIYGVTPFPKEGEWIVSGGVKPARETRRRALSVRDAIAVAGASPSWDTAIGVDAQGNVQGVELATSQPFFSIETWVGAEAFSYKYQHQVETWCRQGVVNKKKFFGRAPYTTKLQSFSYNGRIESGPEGEALVRLRWDFEVGENLIYDPDTATGGLVIPGMDHPLTLMAWDVLDVRESTVAVTSTPRPEDAAPAKPDEEYIPTEWLIKQPVAARACVVMHELDFKKLGIGTG
ncbi:MAG: hypothetical protein ACYTGL_14750 [Planctomycetota bacterium]|jgi:hypothetical protein